MIGNVASDLSNDLLSLDVDARHWTRLAPKGSPPTPRSHHSSCVVGRRLFVFGGRVRHGSNNQLFMIELGVKKLYWQEIRVTGALPGSRYGAALCSVGKNRLVLYGGMPSLVHTDLYLFDGLRSGDPQWKRVSTSGGYICIGDKPMLRHGACLVYAGEKILMFGGEAPDGTSYYELVADKASS